MVDQRLVDDFNEKRPGAGVNLAMALAAEAWTEAGLELPPEQEDGAPLDPYAAKLARIAQEEHLQAAREASGVRRES